MLSTFFETRVKNLFLFSGEKWHFRRKLLTPTFHSNLIEVYLKTVKEETNVLISCFEKEVDRWFDVVPYVKRATLDIICGKSLFAALILSDLT